MAGHVAVGYGLTSSQLCSNVGESEVPLRVTETFLTPVCLTWGAKVL